MNCSCSKRWFCLSQKSASLSNTSSSISTPIDDVSINDYCETSLDDIVNFIPARLSVVFLAISSLLLKKNTMNCLRIILRDGKKNPSPNSGIPEAAFAGALEVQLGGLNHLQLC